MVDNPSNINGCLQPNYHLSIIQLLSHNLCKWLCQFRHFVKLRLLYLTKQVLQTFLPQIIFRVRTLTWHRGGFGSHIFQMSCMSKCWYAYYICDEILSLRSQTKWYLFCGLLHNETFYCPGCHDYLPSILDSYSVHIALKLYRNT